MFNLTFAIYAVETGEILRWGQAPNQDLALLQVRPGEEILYGDYNPLYTRVVGGEPVDYTQEERDLRDNPPTFSHLWDPVQLAWADTRTPAEINEGLANDLRAEMTALESSSQRAVREALLGQGLARLQTVNDRMNALRTQLQQLLTAPTGP